MPLPAKLLDGFKYRIDKLKPTESALLKWPEIAAHKDIFLADDAQGDPELIVRYMILMYGHNTPLEQIHPIIGKRKTYALELLDIPVDSDGRSKEYNDMLLLRGDGIRRRFVAMITSQASMDWRLMCHAAESIEELLRLSSLETKDGMDIAFDIAESQKIRNLIEETRKQYESAKERLIKKENSIAADAAIEYFTAQRTLNLRIEERLQNIKPVLPENAKEKGVNQ